MTTYAPQTRPRKTDDQPPVTPKRPDPFWAKVCVILGAVIMVVSGGVIVVPRVILAWATHDIPTAPLIPPDLIGADIDGPINLLLLGMDERQGNSTEPIRADTIIIVHIPKDHKSVYLISVPRDSEVNIPAFPATSYPGGRAQKVNAAFAAGAKANGKPDDSTQGRQRGAQLTMLTISQLIPGGLKFNGAAIINFIGFQAVLQAIGGVHMCVDVETRSIQYDRNGVYHTMIWDVNQRKVYPVGCYDMDAVSALDYARQRHVEDGDYTRQRHQQQLLLAIFDKVVSKDSLSLGRLTDLQKVAGGLFTLDLGTSSIGDWLFTLKDLRSKDVVMIKTNGGKFATLADGNEAVTKDTLTLFKAVHDDTVGNFLTTHPDWIAQRK
jgi:LCP family protein required for cell wall assembly